MVQITRDAINQGKRGVCDHAVTTADVNDWWRFCVVDKFEGKLTIERFGSKTKCVRWWEANLKRQHPRIGGTLDPTTCALHSSEAGLFKSHFGVPSAAERAYSLMRYPRDHVLSMYFHCTESNSHADRAHHMPSTFDKWLQGFVAYQNTTDAITKSMLKGKLEEYRCYTPINMQSQRLDARSKSDLLVKFDVVGITDEMEVSTCLISIGVYGTVPDRCNCSDASPYFVDTAAIRDHKVTHHGATTKTTPEQDRLIAALTAVDLDLYNAAKELLKEKIRETERRYGFQLCRGKPKDVPVLL
jgi:hypothetical protein